MTAIVPTSLAPMGQAPVARKQRNAGGALSRYLITLYSDISLLKIYDDPKISVPNVS